MTYVATAGLSFFERLDVTAMVGGELTELAVVAELERRGWQMTWRPPKAFGDPVGVTVSSSEIGMTFRTEGATPWEAIVKAAHIVFSEWVNPGFVERGGAKP